MTSRRNGREATAKGLTSATLPATTVVTNIPAPGKANRLSHLKVFLNLFTYRCERVRVCAYQIRLRQPTPLCAGGKMLQWHWRCQELHYQEPEMSHPDHRQQSRKIFFSEAININTSVQKFWASPYFLASKEPDFLVIWFWAIALQCHFWLWNAFFEGISKYFFEHLLLLHSFSVQFLY